MKTPGSVSVRCMRIRSPRIAPPEKGLVGSTATIATVAAAGAVLGGQPVHQGGLAGARRTR